MVTTSSVSTSIAQMDVTISAVCECAIFSSHHECKQQFGCDRALVGDHPVILLLVPHETWCPFPVTRERYTVCYMSSVSSIRSAGGSGWAAIFLRERLYTSVTTSCMPESS